MPTTPESKLHESSAPDKPFRLYTAASIGPAIRSYRERAGITQQELADMAGLHRSYLSQLERGNETQQLRRILRLLKLLGVRATLQKADW
jgi:HTH-type transcriptional regulator / antitoxin HipB